MKTTIRFFHVVLALLPIVLLPDVQAVSPPPDGGYPSGNTAEGQNALLSLTSGQFNTAVGFLSLGSDNTNSFNTAIGAGALLANTADQNTAVGAGALLSNTTGANNTANGSFALFSNTTGHDNTAVGAGALLNNTSSHNTAIGSGALSTNTVGGENTAVGDAALSTNTSGGENTALGQGALFSNDAGSSNTAVGFETLVNNTAGVDNAALGRAALLHNVDGTENTAVGTLALTNNVSGGNNTAVGRNALGNNTGAGNTALGINAGANLTTGDQNLDLGNPGVIAESLTTRIGLNQTKAFIAGIRGVTTVNNNAIPVLIDSAGQLGTASSSQRFKKDIQPMDKSSEAILALKPVTFHYKTDNTNRPEFGLIAEQVAEVNPDLVVRDDAGKIYTVRYDAVNAMLLNEFLKAHRKMEEQQATITQLKTQFESERAEQRKQIKALASTLQKVSAELDVNKAAAKMVLNSR